MCLEMNSLSGYSFTASGCTLRGCEMQLKEHSNVCDPEEVIEGSGRLSETQGLHVLFLLISNRPCV